MYFYSPVVILCFLIFAASTESRRLRKRRDDCEYGIYQHEGKTCCRCPSGSHVKSHCTGTNQTDCQLCEPDSYMDHSNSDHWCQPCKHCSSNANMEMKEKCTKYSNTVCKCKKGFFCASGDQCRVCHPCDTCKDHGVKKQCTETNNTVCNEEGSNLNLVNPWIIAAAVLVPLFLISGVVLYLWRTNKFCFKNNKSTKEEMPEDEVPLKDITPHLLQIADVLSLKTMKHVALLTGMRKVDIENQEMMNPKDAKEQTYGLLEAWSQAKGLNDAYPTLIKTLQEMNQKRTVDEIRNIVEKR